MGRNLWRRLSRRRHEHVTVAGQAAIVLEGAPTADNIFYRLCPPLMFVPLVLLATIATIVASHSIITGAFSMTRQAIQLGDAAFLAAKLAKVADGGYVPLLLATAVYGVMLVWHTGAQAVSARLRESVVPIGRFMAQITEGRVPRVPDTTVFLTRTDRDAPPVMVWHLKHNRAPHGTHLRPHGLDRVGAVATPRG